MPLTQKRKCLCLDVSERKLKNRELGNIIRNFMLKAKQKKPGLILQDWPLLRNKEKKLQKNEKKKRNVSCIIKFFRQINYFITLVTVKEAAAEAKTASIKKAMGK
jgi:RIO-like serine/threonine protein kinase